MKIHNLGKFISAGLQRKTNFFNLSRYLNNVSDIKPSSGNQIDQIMVNRNFFLDEPNPTNHLPKHIGMFYKIPKETNNTLFAVYGWSDRQKLIFETFDEASIMIRRYAIEIMQKIRKGELLGDKFERYILYGLNGSGKTLSLNHLIHFAHKSNFVVVHVNEILNLTRLPFEYRVSEFKKKEGRVDTPMNGTMLLQHFKAQNMNLIKDLKLSKAYNWSLKECNEKNEPLINLINHGINRSDHSSDCYAVLLKELKLAADQGMIKLFVAIEDINFLYWPTDLRRPDRTYYTTKDLSVTRAMRKLISNDFKNGLLVATTEARNHPRWDPDEQNLDNLDPHKLLLSDGVQELKNFHTVQIDKYDDFEFYNCLAYYNDKFFITHAKALTTEGLKQLKFITTKLPKDVFEQMKWL